MGSEQENGFTNILNHPDSGSYSEPVIVDFVRLGDIAGNQCKRYCCLFRCEAYYDGVVQWPTCRQRRSSMEGSGQDEREERIGQNRRPHETG